MNFVLWVCRSMHVFGVIVWLGGLMFQNAIAQPILTYESDVAKSAMRNIHNRFTGFIWMSVWTVGATGIILMLLNPRFFWFRYDDRWSVLLGLKQLAFLLMTVYAFGHARMLSLLQRAAAGGAPPEELKLAEERAGQFRKISIFLGITSILMATAMV